MSTVSSISRSNSFSVPDPNHKGGWLGKNLDKYAFRVQRFGEGENMTFTIKFYRLRLPKVEPDGTTKDESNLIAQLDNTTEGKITLIQANLKEKEKVGNAQDEIIKVFKSQLKSQAHLLQVAQSLTHKQEENLAGVAGLENLAKGAGDSSTTIENKKKEDEDDGDKGKKPFWDTYDWDIDGINTKLTNINIKGRSFRDTYKNLYYPEGLGSNRQDRIRFTQKYSQGRKVNVSLGSDTKVFQREPEIKIDGSVTLPIVTGIGDRNAVDWKDESLNPIQALGAGAAVSIFEGVKKDGLTQAFEDAAGAFRGAGGALKDDQNIGGNMAKAINVYLAQQAVGAQGLLSRATGAILNPNLEMLFGGPKLRSFGFTFKLSPRDASEASQVRQIIRFFKQGMSVKTSSSNVFLKTPNIFDIQYQTFNTDGNLIDHPSINFIKTCALTSCDVQYTPDGTYMTYEDPYRTLTSYQLTLNFGELDPIFDDDYTDLDDNNDTSIGY